MKTHDPQNWEHLFMSDPSPQNIFRDFTKCLVDKTVSLYEQLPLSRYVWKLTAENFVQKRISERIKKVSNKDKWFLCGWVSHLSKIIIMQTTRIWGKYVMVG